MKKFLLNKKAKKQQNKLKLKAGKATIKRMNSFLGLEGTIIGRTKFSDKEANKLIERNYGNW